MLPLTSISGRFLITTLNNDFMGTRGSIEHLTQSDKSENNDNAS